MIVECAGARRAHAGGTLTLSETAQPIEEYLRTGAFSEFRRFSKNFHVRAPHSFK